MSVYHPIIYLKDVILNSDPFVEFFMNSYSSPSLTNLDEEVASAWSQFRKSIPPYINASLFSTVKSQLIFLNKIRFYDEGNHTSIYDAIEKLFIKLLQDALKPCNLSSNITDIFFPLILRSYCVSQEPECGQTKALDCGFFYEPDCRDVKNITIIPHITTPFILMLIRYTYYHQLVRKMVADVNYRHFVVFYQDYDFSKVTKVDWGRYSPRDVFEQYVLSYQAGALEDIGIDYYKYKVKKFEDIPHHWFLTLVETEGQRLRRDYSFLQKHFDRRFVASLMEWHQFYFDYLVECLHNCEEFKDYPVENLVPSIILKKTKPKTIDENRALTPLGKSCRRAVVAKIQECKTAADYGALLHKFQYESNFFTKNRLSRNEYYLFMQQIGKVKFGSSGDFSNCNKGFYLAEKKAANG